MTMSTPSPGVWAPTRQDQVPFEKYAKAAESLLKPSSAARAVASGAPFIERVDLLVKLVSRSARRAQRRDRPHGRRPSIRN